MSSRLFSGGLGEAARIEWRSAGGGSPAAPHAGAVRRAGAQSQPEESVEARVQAAYARGLGDGEAKAGRIAGELAAPVLANFGAMLKELAAARQRAREEAEESMVRLALAIARRVLHRELSVDPEAILGLVRSGIDKLSAREIHRLRVSPGDARIVLDNRGDLAIPSAVEILADAALAPGNAIFETVRGDLDVSVQTQLEEIERGFADVMVQRAVQRLP